MKDQQQPDPAKRSRGRPRMFSDRRRVSMFIDADDYEVLKASAEAGGQTVSSLLRDLVKEHVFLEAEARREDERRRKTKSKKATRRKER